MRCTATSPIRPVKDDFLQYSTDKGMRRFGTISNARGRPVAEIDVDYSPAQLEDTFADEDRRTLAAARQGNARRSRRS